MNQPLGEAFPSLSTTILAFTSLDLFFPHQSRVVRLYPVFTLCTSIDKKAWMRIASFLQTLDFHQISQHFFPNSKPGEAPKIAISRLPWEKIHRQHTPLTPRFHPIQDSIHQAAPAVYSPVSILSCGKMRLDKTLIFIP